ncbi:MAG TPA: hypothetical protein VGG16_23515, partial [Streptosporangiaceae bacterium]
RRPVVTPCLSLKSIPAEKMPGVTEALRILTFLSRRAGTLMRVVVRSDLPDAAHQVTGADERQPLWLAWHGERNWRILLYPRVVY